MTHQTAQVVIKNSTGRPFRSVNVLHKYSDDYKNRGDWGSGSDSAPPLPGAISSPMTVDYNTGAFTTGKDWWLVTWEYEGDHKVYYTNPNNFRDIIDFLEAPVKRLINMALDAMDLSAGKVIVDALFNSETTAGFKQHILRDEDAGRQTQIVINADNMVQWLSPSGTSDTGWGVYGDMANADFSGNCGEGSTRGAPMAVTSVAGLQPNEKVRINGTTDLSGCLIGNDDARVYGISMSKQDGDRIYDYILNVDAQGPEGFGSGSMYLAFTDESGDRYDLSIYSSSRSVHTLKYNSQKPIIKKIQWSDYSF